MDRRIFEKKNGAFKMKMLLEVCCNGYEDGLKAFKAGADRIELNSAIYLGGLSANLLHLKLLKKEVNIPVVCMVRERGAGFLYSELEKMLMFEQAKMLLENGADGIVFGFLNKDMTIDSINTKKMVELAGNYGKEAIFNRAFDMVKDPFESLETLIECGVDRVLTSGLEADALKGKKMIKSLIEKAMGRIEILAGCGIKLENIERIMDIGLTQIHGSFKKIEYDNSAQNQKVNQNYLPFGGYETVDLETVVKIKKIIESKLK